MNKLFVHKLFEKQAERFANAVAIEDSIGTSSYRDLNRDANRLANIIVSLGRTKEVVVVLMESCVESVISNVGLFKAGAVYLPIDIKFSTARLKQIFASTFNGVMVTNWRHVETTKTLVKDLGVALEFLVIVDREKPPVVLQHHNGSYNAVAGYENISSQNPELPLAGSDSNYIYYTSGSTGQGKAILGRHDSLAHFVNWELKEFALKEGVRVSQITQLTFDASLRDIWVPLLAGGTLCIPPDYIKENASMFVEWIRGSKVALVHCVPSVLRLITNTLKSSERLQVQKLEDLKFIMVAGEILYGKDIKNFRDVAGDHVEVVNLYGATETTLIKTFYRVREIPENLSSVIPVGKPIDNTAIAVINNKRLCKVGEIGEVYIKTPFTTKGYIDNEHEMNLAFVQNPLVTDKKDIVYKTGDQGRYLSDGSVEVLGRLDNQTKINGVRVELNEIEKAMLGIGEINQVAVISYKAFDNNNYLVAYYTGQSVEADQIKAFLKSLLNENVIPSVFIHLENFPLNINGKIDRKALKVPEEYFQHDNSYVAPSNAIEGKLEKIWCDILGLKRASSVSSFFSIGGHSLRAIQLVSRIYEEFEVNLKLTDVFKYPTIKSLAAAIGGTTSRLYEPIPVAKVRDHYPLSPAQKRFWILDQIKDDQTAYNMASAYTLVGDIEIGALEKAFGNLVKRHAALRTTFHAGVDWEPIQKVNSYTAHAAVEYLDLRSFEDRNARAERLAYDEVAMGFDLAHGPLLRTKLVQLEQNEFLFLLTMHHIISDGWSLDILMREVMTYYNAVVSGEEVTIAPLNIQYQDYVLWQHESFEKSNVTIHEDYWLKEYGGELPVLDLPIDFHRPSVQTYNGGAVEHEIPRTVVIALDKICQENEATIFMVLLSAVNILLHRMSSARDIILGVPLSGRLHKDTEGLIGLFLNTVAIRFKFEDEVTFGDLLKKVRTQVLSAFEHQAYPLDRLIEKLNLNRDFSRSPLFDVAVIYQNDLDLKKADTLTNVEVSPYEVSAKVSKHDVEFYFTEVDGAIKLHTVYNDDLFMRDSVVKMNEDLLNILKVVVGDREMRISYDSANDQHSKTVEISKEF